MRYDVRRDSASVIVFGDDIETAIRILRWNVANYKTFKTLKMRRFYATSKKYLIDFIKDYFGENKLLCNIRYVDLETFRNRLKQTTTKHEKDRADASVNRCMACLRHMLGKAVEWEMIKQNPFEMGQGLMFKENNERLRYLSKDEIDRLLAECSRQVIELPAKNSRSRSRLLFQGE